MKSRNITSLLALAIMLNSITPAFGGESPDPDKVRKLTKVIKQKYRNIGQNLVLLTFAKTLGESIDFQRLDEDRRNSLSVSQTGDSIEGRITEIQNELYPLLFSEQPVVDKENRFRELFLDLEQGFYKFQNTDFQLLQIRDQILSEFSTKDSLCTQKSFQETLSYMDATSPTLFKFTDLTLDHRFEVNFTYSEETGASANGAFDVDSNQETKMAVSAAVGMATQIIIAGSAGGPPGVAAGAIAAAVALTVKLAWDINDLRKHNKVMKEMYKANRELFENMNMTEQIEKSFMSTCSALENAYTASRPHVLAILADFSSTKEKLESVKWLEEEVSNLEKLGSYEEQAYTPSLTEDEEAFGRFFKYHLYKKILTLQNMLNGSQNLKNIFIQQYFHTKRMIYNAIEQMYLLDTPSNQSIQEISFTQYFEQLQRIELVRAEFHDIILLHISEQDLNHKKRLLIQAENLITTFESFTSYASQERDDFLRMAKSTISSLGELL
jgi:hypothetical protein